MTALLEYLDLTALLEYIDLLSRYSGGPFQAGARGKMPQLPPPVGGPVYITNCLFQENTAYGEGAALFLVDGNTGSSASAYQSFITIRSNFTTNSGGNSVVYISAGSTFTIIFLDSKSVFHNNIGTVIHLLSSTLRFGQFDGNVIFSSNSANSGGELYCEHGTTLFFYHESRINFTNNSAAQYGGAIYADLGSKGRIQGGGGGGGFGG